MFVFCLFYWRDRGKEEESELASREQEGAEDEMIGCSLRNENRGTEGVFSYSLTRVKLARDKSSVR